MPSLLHRRRRYGCKERGNLRAGTLAFLAFAFSEFIEPKLVLNVVLFDVWVDSCIGLITDAFRSSHSQLGEAGEARLRVRSI